MTAVDRQPKADSRSPVVVAIGGSAAGLASVEALLDRLPSDTGFAYLIAIPRADPTDGARVERLRQRGVLPVAVTERAGVLRPDHVCVWSGSEEGLVPAIDQAAGNVSVRTATAPVIDHSLHLASRLSTGSQPCPAVDSPIDALFLQVACRYGPRAIGIVLSGPKPEGAGGLQEIVRHGGLAIAQSPGSSPCNEMPRAVIASRAVDRVLPIDGIADEMSAYADYLREVERRRTGGRWEARLASAMPVIVSILDEVAEHRCRREDLSTLRRCVLRRMQRWKTLEVTDYVKRLREDFGEALALVAELPSVGSPPQSERIVDGETENAPISPRAELANFFRYLPVASFLLDVDQRIVSYTPQASRIYNVRASDIGRPLWQLAHHAREMPAFPALEQIDQSGRAIEDDFETNGGEWYRRCIRPYRSADQRSLGFVVSFLDISDHLRSQQTAEALRVRERAIESLTKGIVVADARQSDHPITYTNGGFQQMTGYSHEDVVGKNCRILQGEDTDPKTVREMREALGEHRECQVTVKNYRKDGTPFWNELLITPVQDERGTVTHFVGVQRDVTDHMQRDDQLRTLAAIAEQSNDFIGIAGLDGKVIFINPAGKKLVGLSPSQPVDALTVSDFFFPSDLETVHHDFLPQVMQEGKAGQEIRFRHFISGTPIDVYWNVFRIDDPHTGKAIAMGTVTQDMRERKANERKLRHNETFLRRTLDSLFTFAAVCEPDGRLIEVNRPALQVASLQPEDVLGKAFDQTYWFAHDHRLQQKIRAALQRAARGEKSRFDVEIQTAPGQRLPIDFQLVPMYDDQGNVTHLIPSAIDISDRKQFENRLKNERLRADAANRSKSEFLANMSHEIRTPMTAIIGYAELLSSQLKRSENRKLVETIRKNGHYLLEIISDILDLSKIEADRLSIQHLEIALPQFLREVHALMKLRADEKKIDFSFFASTEVPVAIETDPVRLRQILINLIGNAIKFTEQGHVHVDVSYAPASGTLRFAVIDTGIGIEPENHEIIFQPFSQVDTSDTRAAGGTGLGLAISRRLAETLNGRIEMTSKPGVGSTFAFALRLEGASDVDLVRWPSADEEEALRRPRSLAPLQLDCRVLLVDDRREIRFLGKRFIESAGGRVETAIDGEKALAAIANAERADEPFDLVLTDIQMPKMDGYELTRRLRAGGFRQPIVALTAHALKKDFDKCFAVGCDAFSSKPLEKDEFLRLVHRYTTELSLEEIELARTQRNRDPGGYSE